MQEPGFANDYTECKPETLLDEAHVVKETHATHQVFPITYGGGQNAGGAYQAYSEKIRMLPYLERKGEYDSWNQNHTRPDFWPGYTHGIWDPWWGGNPQCFTVACPCSIARRNPTN